MDTNFYSFVEMVRQYVKRKYSDGGSIVVVSSIASVQPEACQTIYAASKAAVNAVVQAVSLELAKRHIRINAILPGVVRPDQISPEVDELAKGQLLGLIDAADVAGAIAFLLSDMAKYVTGRNLYLDAGRFR
jgi:NAD(P)-dependent dehydrogenase (short-subunit alcohol dehydrogenase family)